MSNEVQQADGNEKLVESMGSVKAARLLNIIITCLHVTK